MDVNNTGILEFNDSFSQDEIIHEYKKLLEKYKHLKTAHDDDQQKIYELKRNWETAASAESYLSQELELVASSQASEIENLQQKYQCELDELKKKHSASSEDYNYLEQRVEEYREENESLRKKIEELETAAPEEAPTTTCGSMERELQLAKENLELLAKVDELRDQTTSSMMQIAERDRQIEIMKENCECLEENLKAKREEVDEKSHLLESSQERVMELSAELAMLKAAPEDTNRKGNSLFAEVDDQRQQMRRMLGAQKKHYLQMKKSYNESEQEIRRLKRENAAMHKEMQVCATIFLSADKRYKEKLNERILQLINQNEEFQKKLMWTQDKLISVSRDKGINWLDSMLAFCRTETEELKEQLRSIRIQKAILEENLQSSQQELAKWRFEALKSRCIIINRETLLEENKIEFKPIILNIPETDLHNAQPEIFKKTESNTEKRNSPATQIASVEISKVAPPENLSISIHTISPDTPKKELIINQITPIKIEITNTKGETMPQLNLTPTSSRKTFIIKDHVRNSPATKIKTDNCDSSTAGQTARTSPTTTGECVFTIPRTFSKTPFKKKCEMFKDESDSSKESGSFEIYEDTVCRMPTIRCKDITSMQSQSENSVTDTLAKLSVKTDDSSQSSSDNVLGNFEIYEDTVCRLPVVKQNAVQNASKENSSILANSQSTDSHRNNVLKDKSDWKKAKTSLSPVLVDHDSLSPSAPASILVKSRGLFDEIKNVTFSPELTTEFEIERNVDRVPEMKPRKKQVVVKHIVIKSKLRNE